VKFGFAGVGHPHALSWAQAAKDNGAEIVATFDPLPQRARAHADVVGGLVVGQLEDLAKHGLDAVIVDGRCNEVTDLALGVTALNLPILMEKPGGMRADDLALVEREVISRGLASQMGYFLRYARPVQEAKRALASGELGQLSLVRCHAAMPHRAWEVMGEWFGDPTNITSIFQEDACHVVDIMIDLLGLPKAITALRTKENFSPSVGEDSIAAIWDYGTHLATIDFTAHEANPWIDTWSVEVFGTRGTMRAGMSPEWLERYEASRGWIESGEDRMTGPSDGHARDASTREHYRIGMAGFLNAIQTGEPAPANVSKGLAVFRTVEAIAAAADCGCRIELG
jgi:predicted dehydrogenase